jgi:hypothetical protein
MQIGALKTSEVSLAAVVALPYNPRLAMDVEIVEGLDD